MDAKGPTAKPEDVEHYLRNLGAKDWGASLDAALLPRKRNAKKAGAAAGPGQRPGATAAESAATSATSASASASPPPPPEARTET